jgi:hypothetical protein
MAFDRSMILLNEIVEVLITSHFNILPLRILAPQKPKGHVTLQVGIGPAKMPIRSTANDPKHVLKASFRKMNAEFGITAGVHWC